MKSYKQPFKKSCKNIYSSCHIENGVCGVKGGCIKYSRIDECRFYAQRNIIGTPMKSLLPFNCLHCSVPNHHLA